MKAKNFFLLITLCISPLNIYAAYTISRSKKELECFPECTKRLMCLYNSKYQIPSKEFFEKYIMPLKQENDSKKCIALFNTFIFMNVKQEYEKDKEAFESYVTQCVYKRAKDTGIERKARKEVIFCKYLNIAYCIYASYHDSCSSLDEYTIEDIFSQMSMHLEMKGISIISESNEKIIKKYSQKVIESWQTTINNQQNNSMTSIAATAYISPLDVMKFNFVKQYIKQKN